MVKCINSWLPIIITFKYSEAFLSESFRKATRPTKKSITVSWFILLFSILGSKVINFVCLERWQDLSSFGFFFELAKTYLLTSFGSCCWFLSDLAMCMALCVGFYSIIFVILVCSFFPSFDGTILNSTFVPISTFGVK